MPPPAHLRPDRSFERLYRRHVASVYRYALAMLRNPSDAEDVTQSTFLNAYRVYQQGERPRAAHSWLMAIAHNACRQRFRDLRRRDEVSLDESSVVSVAADEDVPRVEDIQRALANLAFNQRAALVMRELEGRPYAEIGEVLGLSTSAVETLIFRARRALREQLEGSLTCADAELAINRQLDRRLPRSEKGYLRAHLRECSDCSSLARRERARRAALRGLGAIPLPHSLASFFGGGSAAGGGLAVKAAAVVAAGAVVGGTGYEAVQQAPWRAPQDVAAAKANPVVPDVAQARRAAPPRAAAPVVATPARKPVTARAQRTVRPKAVPVAVKTAKRTALPVAAVEPSATPARPESRPERNRAGPARGPKAKSPRGQANGRARPGQARAPGQTKPKPQTKNAARKAAAAKKPKPAPAAAPGPGRRAERPRRAARAVGARSERPSGSGEERRCAGARRRHSARPGEEGSQGRSDERGRPSSVALAPDGLKLPFVELCSGSVAPPSRRCA